MTPVHARYVYTEECAVTSARDAVLVRSRLLAYIPYFGWFLLAVSVLCAVTQGIRHVPLMTVAIGLALAAFPFVIRQQIRRNYRNSKMINSEVLWTFSETEVEVQGPGTKTTLEWKRISEVHELPGSILLRFDSQYSWLPRKAFPSESDLSLFRTLVEKAGISYKKTK